jgi:hypothetical protein
MDLIPGYPLIHPNPVKEVQAVKVSTHSIKWISDISEPSQSNFDDNPGLLL